MTIRNILCAYSGEDGQASGLDHAIRMARHHDAWLTGVLCHGRHALERSSSARIPEAVRSILREADNARIAEAQARFQAAVAEGYKPDRAEFVDLDPDSAGPLSAFARCFDMVVTGAHSARPDEDHLSAHPDTLALQSGRPVLVVPDDYEADALADHAVVAWDGGRAAARAIGDAVDILAEKARVTILSVGRKSTAPDHVDALLRHLKRHGIEAVSEHRAQGHASIAQTIEMSAKELGARLIVMGAFEHSKFRHDLFGGVTTEVIGTATVPVFMSH
ncbi:universal stress protein [Mameliella sp. AT18]|uniref:universal stress protein n=1 Tax=Mameliella sp. AT18 TaxID=3028385 RepID=UPI000841021D|nr:universal stress protein [Mameliella sp. AT18]MDD9730909.1 universal stress protein [Mameliella sp. AT18]ODM47461.1 hypothetical protein A9320_22630 [Ruegeria sp. PBVC088]